MNYRNRLAAIAVCSLTLGLLGASSFPASPGMPANTKAALHPWGVSLAGPEFGVDKPGFSNENPGIFGCDYTYNSERTIQYFRSTGATQLRLPIRWERIQPRLGEDLDELELARLGVCIGWCISMVAGRLLICTTMADIRSCEMDDLCHVLLIASTEEKFV